MSRFTRLRVDDLWPAADSTADRFDPAVLADLPPLAARYLQHAIAPGTPLASAVRLKMKGTLRLRDRWLPFRAEQVIHWPRGFIWRAATRMGPLPILGSDRWIEGRGAMRWNLLGLVPLVRAEGDDVSRSAARRLAAETIWLPSVLLGAAARWQTGEAGDPRVSVTTADRRTRLDLEVGDDGRLVSLATTRWGDPGGSSFRELPFGALIEEEGSFEGFTIPTRLRVGWYFGSDRFESEGEFWRASIQAATYR